MDNNKIDPRVFQAETVYEQQMAGVVGAGPSMANEAASVAQGLAGWTIKRHEDGWIFFKRPDDFRQSVTPNEPTGSHAQTLHMLLDALLAQAAPAASVAQLTDQIKTTWSSRLGYGITRQELEIVVHIIDAILAQAAPPAAPVQGVALTDGTPSNAQQAARILSDLRGEVDGDGVVKLRFSQRWAIDHAVASLLAAPAAPATGGSGAEALAYMRVGTTPWHGYEACAADDPNGFPVYAASPAAPTIEPMYGEHRYRIPAGFVLQPIEEAEKSYATAEARTHSGRDGTVRARLRASAQQDEREALQVFKEHLNDLRDLDVSAAFHRIVGLADAMAFAFSQRQAQQVQAGGEDKKDAARWRMVPAFLEDYQIDYMRLVRDIDAAMSREQPQGDSNG